MAVNETNFEMRPMSHSRDGSDACDGGPSSENLVSGTGGAIREVSIWYTAEEEKAVIMKLDQRLVLFVAFLYMLSFLDRSNIGNAKLAGMDIDLRLNSNRFEWLLRSFYVTYIAFEWMTMLWKVFRPSRYLAICVASWGLIASLQALTTSFTSLVILRACLGIGEAAFVGIPFYLSFFFRNHELAFRVGLFISAAPLATAFAGTLAWVITSFADKYIPIASWRILFLFEGFPSVAVAILVWLYIPDRPGQATYLTQRQRKIAKHRLRQGSRHTQQVSSTTSPEIDWIDVFRTLRDPKAILTALMFFCCNVAFSSLPVFLPTILEEMGYSTIDSQGLSAPPYLVAFTVVLLSAWLSDRWKARGSFVIFHAMLAAIGYTMMAITGHLQTGPLARYLGVYPAASGFFSAITIIITWTINNQQSDSSKGVGLSMLNYIGQLGPLLGVHLYPERDGPFYTKGMVICAGSMVLVALLAWWLRAILVRQNRRRDTEQRKAVGSVSRLGQDAFRFMI